MGIVITVSCNKGIDPITHIAPGADLGAPVVTVKYPAEGLKIQVPTLLASINIQFEVTDDIELKSVAVLMDGNPLTSYNEFPKDYRRAVKEYLYNQVTNGAHVLTIRATDLSGKITNKEINFEKKPPYVPIFPGELFYMPFDGDYMDKVSFVEAGKVGTPGFAGEALKGLNAYAGATDSYLTFPLAGLKNNEFSAEMWYKLNAVPDRSGIITISPSGESNFDASRTKGLRFFREGGAGASQRFKLNAGSGASESWFDGGSKADVQNNVGDWVHLAFTVSGSECVVYINGQVVSQGSFTGIDWTGCESISIGSGAPNFTDWGHKADNSFYDELRIFNKALTQSEIQAIIQHDSPYVPKYSGEILYMPFEGNYNDLVSNTEAAKVGSPDFADGKKGKAYAGATDSYLTFPTTEIVKSNQFSSVFWMKVNASPDRSGILAICPTGAANFDAMRTKGLRIFREGDATSQRLKLNAGIGSSESWNDGGLVDPRLAEWVHVAYTISATESKIYINGILTRAASTFAGGIDWTGCSSMSIGSGAPTFIDWGHLADLSLIDELRIFNKALTEDEVNAIMNAEK